MAARDQVAAKAAAWKLRQRGRTLATIAREVGVDESTVSRWIADLDRKALDRLVGDVATAKAFQAGVLGHVLEEALDAWDASKRPATRVKEVKGPDEPMTDDAGNVVLDGQGKPVLKPAQKITEVVQQTGDVAYLDRALATLAAIRKLWGLDVAEKPNDAGPFVFAERLKALKERAARFDAARRQNETERVTVSPPDATTPAPAAAPDVGPVA